MQWLARMSLLSSFVLFAGEGWADSLQQNFSAHASEEYVTNPLLNPAFQGLSGWRSTVEPNYILTDTLGADELKASLDLLLVRSSNTSIIADGDYPTATLGWNRLQDKGKFGISTSYSVAPTLVAAPSTVGLVSANSSMTSRNLSADLTRELSERTTLTLNGAYSDIAFSGSGNTASLMDYASQSGGLKLNYVLGEHTATFVNLSYLGFVPSGGAPTSSIYNAWLGLNWNATERLDWILQGGPSRLESAGVAGAGAGSGAGTSTSLQGGVTMNYKGQLSGLILNANRQSTPSGLGAIIIIDQANGSLSYDLGERSKTGIDLGWSKYNYVSGDLSRTAGAWLRHDFNTSWWMKAYVNHITNVWGGLNPALSNTIGFSITYTNF